MNLKARSPREKVAVGCSNTYFHSSISQCDIPNNSILNELPQVLNYPSPLLGSEQPAINSFALPLSATPPTGAVSLPAKPPSNDPIPPHSPPPLLHHRYRPPPQPHPHNMALPPPPPPRRPPLHPHHPLHPLHGNRLESLHAADRAVPRRGARLHEDLRRDGAAGVWRGACICL